MTPAPARLAAAVIAVVAVVDPAVTATRSSRPIVAVVETTVQGAAQADRVANDLGRRFKVVRGPLAAAAGTVIVGDALPDESGRWSSPLFAVVPSTRIRIVRLDAPTVVTKDARVPIDVGVAVNGAAGRRLDVQLRAGGLLVDRQQVNVPDDSATVPVRLSHAPAAGGPVELRVSATLSGTSAVAEATTVTDVVEARHDVLFFDARPSWMSTFVRRALEDDARFAVTSRVQASRGVSLTAGSPPATLRDALGLAAFATVVIGAPEALVDVDVAGLDAFLRGRGGRVVLLMDRRASGAIDRLTSARDWRARRLSAPTTVVAAWDTATLRAREVAWPAVLPLGAASVVTRTARDSSTGAVMWSVPVGAGRLVVSGALDAWHYRDASMSAFEAFWRNTIADLSAGAPRPVEVTVGRRSLRPGEGTSVRVSVVRTALANTNAPRSASVSAVLVSGTDSTAVRLWPELAPGRFAGTVIAPRTTGTYRLAVTSGIDRIEVPVMVDSLAQASSGAEGELIGAFAASRGGQAFHETDLASLPDRLAAAVQPVPRVETWHPMRSPWWIIPFALLLGAEWWWRRRRGLA